MDPQGTYQIINPPPEFVYDQTFLNQSMSYAFWDVVGAYVFGINQPAVLYGHARDEGFLAKWQVNPYIPYNDIFQANWGVTLGACPTTLEALPEYLWQLHLQHASFNYSPLFITWQIPPANNGIFAANHMNVDDVPYLKEQWANSGMGGLRLGFAGIGADWYAYTIYNAPYLSGYCLLGHAALNNADRQTLGPGKVLLLAHQSICLWVPSLCIGMVGPSYNRNVYIADPSTYDNALFTPLGIYFEASPVYVVLKCMLNYVAKPSGETNPVYVNETTGIAMNVYRPLVNPYNSWTCINIMLPSVSSSNLSVTLDYNAQSWTFQPEFDPLNALMRMAAHVTGTSIGNNVAEGMWQNWIYSNGAINAQRTGIFMDALCNKGITIPGYENICACLDTAVNAQLQAIDPRLTVACYSAPCLAGNSTVYKPYTHTACPDINICNQKIVLTNVQEASLQNVTFTCDNTHTTNNGPATNNNGSGSVFTTIAIACSVCIGVVIIIIICVVVFMMKKKNKMVIKGKSRGERNYAQRTLNNF